MNVLKNTLLTFFLFLMFSCSDDDLTTTPAVVDCTSNIVFDDAIGACSEVLSITSQYSETISETTRTIVVNSIPNHKVGLFGKVSGSLNPNAIVEAVQTLNITAIPAENSTYIALLSTTGSGPNLGPQYSFGVLFSGVELDPIPAEPFPHEGMMSANVNWEWNLEALNVDIGLDCNYAHVQPSGKYHYHGKPTLYLEELEITANTMTLIGYAADGFPIYYKYAYTEAEDNGSEVIQMTSSYQLKTGDRPGDGVTAPCGKYTGVYSFDYEYIDGLGTLDQANGRTGVTPEYPTGTYYYIITDDFPSIPRYFRGTPSSDFRIN